ncbi:MAG: S1 family peptidase [Myxococcota bacterium]
MIGAKLVAGCALSLLLVGCVGTPEDFGAEELGSQSAAIVNGQREFGEPAVVLVYNRGGGLCSGTLIAPRVVLTAKHCVQRSGAEAPSPTGFFVIGIGDSINNLSESYGVTDIRTTPGVWIDSRGLQGALVGVDVAVMTLDTGVSTVEPRTIRRESPNALIGSTVRAVGFGQTPSGRAGDKYSTTTLLRGVQNGVAYTDPATCQGDSGGPIIDEATGEVFGVTSFGTGGCGTGGIAGANTIDGFLDLIDAAVADSGACLNDGAERCDSFDNDCDDQIDETCAGLGESCTADTDCALLNPCLETPAGRVCTVECDTLRPELSCPGTNLFCAQTNGCTGVCIPVDPASPNLALGESCASDSECESLSCIDPGDGNSRCLTPCQGDQGMCLGGEVCAAVSGGCGGCVPAAIVQGDRGLGEGCTTNDDCRSDLCLEDAGLSTCSQSCTDDSGCPDRFFCRGDVCIQGTRGGPGATCAVNSDCNEEAPICASRGTDVSWCTRFCSDMEPCPPNFSCLETAGGSICAPELGLVGESCTDAADCVSGLCEETPAGRVCTRTCGSDSPCGIGTECVRLTDGAEPICVAPSPEPSNESDSGGCSVGSGGGPGVPLAIVAVMLFFARRRWS